MHHLTRRNPASMSTAWYHNELLASGLAASGVMVLKKALLVALALAAPQLSSAAFEGMISVVQPLGLSDSGPILSVVNYIGYTVDPASDAEILYTTRANLTWCDGKCQDRNEASLMGIQFSKLSQSTDTLNVTVNLDSFPNPKGGRILSQYAHELLTTTLWCGLVNARQNWPKIHYVQYRLTGEPQFATYNGVYFLEKVPSLQKLGEYSPGWGPK